MHLKPVEFIHAAERSGLSRRAWAHLERCAACRATLQDLEESLQVLRRAAPPAPSADPAFWDDFTDHVRAAIRRTVRRPAPRTSVAWRARIASMAIVLAGALFTSLVPRNFPRLDVPSAGVTAPVTESDAAHETAPSAEPVMALARLETLDAENYLISTRVDDRLRQDLSFLQLGPSAWSDTGGGWALYLE